MKRSRYTEEQIIGILKQHKAGLGAKELCRKHGISDATFYKWRSKYGGMDVSDARKLKANPSSRRSFTIYLGGISHSKSC
jgi:putative transposase